MVDLVGSTEGTNLTLALKGTTQITGFQQRSFSLHALKDLGFTCAHILTQEGNFLEITPESGTLHRFSLLTINGGVYIEIRIHQPPPESEAAFLVARLDLAKNFETEGLYHLLHLHYSCPGVKQMEMILKGDKTQGVPANVTIPEFF
jgi:hypothetical protein